MKKLIKNIIILLILIFVAILVVNLKIKNISVLENNNTDDTYIIKEFIKSDFDRNLCYFLVKNKLFKHTKIPLIEDYDIRLKGINEIEIKVKETAPILYLRADLKRVLIDNKGYVTEILEKNVNLPEVSGLNFLPPVNGEKLQIIDNIDFSIIIEMVVKLTKNGIFPDLIDVNRAKELTLYIGKIIVNMGDFNYIDVKVDRLIRIYDKIKDYKGTLDLSSARENDPNESYTFKKTS